MWCDLMLAVPVPPPKDGKWLGVQFHPEMAAYDSHNAFGIFQWLVAEAAKVKGGKPRKTTWKQAKAEKEADDAYYYGSTGKGYASSPIGDNAEVVEVEGTEYLVYPGDKDEFTTYDKQRAWAEPKHRAAGSATTPKQLPMSTSCAVPRDNAISGLFCGYCGMLFDKKHDRDDHIRFDLCGWRSDEKEHPELVSPEGHPAWDDVHEDDRAMVQRMLAQANEDGAL